MLKQWVAKRAATFGASEVDPEWLEKYLKGKADWAVSVERNVLSAVLLVRQTIRVLLGQEPMAKSPSAIIVDLNRNPQVIVKNPKNGTWKIENI